ncbi:MAG: hypothetical protein WDM76_00035 [Limisphaerales bacterium]
MNSNSSPPSSAPPIRLGRIARIIVVLVIIGLVIGLVPRWLARRNLLAESHAESVLTVNVVSPTPSKSALGTPLPAGRPSVCSSHDSCARQRLFEELVCGHRRLCHQWPIACGN